jgi:hypothetical protein
MKKICIVPHWGTHFGNRIFDRDQSEATKISFDELRMVALEEGYRLATIDSSPAHEADGIWFVDFPRNRKYFEEILAAKKDATKVVLQVLESPLQVRQSHSRRDQTKCDYVLTYQRRKQQDRRYFHYNLPNNLEREESGISFAERRCVVMINTNKQEGWQGSGAAGSNRFPGFGKYINGWNIPLSKRLMPATGELYSWRRAFARAAEHTEERVLDIYGKGWNGEWITWLPLPRPRPYQCAVGDLKVVPEKTQKYGQKIPLIGHYRFGIAVENYRGTEGYVSEKMIDVIRAGAVPIYLGDESITDVVPAGAFVDARDFSSHAELIRFLVNCAESDWESMRARGRGFLASPEAKVFGVDAFVETAMKILRKL